MNDMAVYIRKHTITVSFLIIVVLVALAAGEYLLYRNQMKLNMMLSEGLMQIKERINEPDEINPTTIQEEEMMMKQENTKMMKGK